MLNEERCRAPQTERNRSPIPLDSLSCLFLSNQLFMARTFPRRKSTVELLFLPSQSLMVDAGPSQLFQQRNTTAALFDSVTMIVTFSHLLRMPALWLVSLFSHQCLCLTTTGSTIVSEQYYNCGIGTIFYFLVFSHSRHLELYSSQNTPDLRSQSYT